MLVKSILTIFRFDVYVEPLAISNVSVSVSRVGAGPGSATAASKRGVSVCWLNPLSS